MKNKRPDGPDAAEELLGRGVASVVRVIEKAAKWPRRGKRAVVIAGDLVLGLVAVWAAFSLRLERFVAIDRPVLVFAACMLGAWFLVATLRRTYFTIFRYAGRGAIIALAAAMFFAAIPLVIGFTLITYPDVPRTLPVLAPLLFLILMTLARIIGRYALVDLVHTVGSANEQRRLIIFGAGNEGRQIASSLSTEANMKLVGMVDDDPGKARLRLDGIAVSPADALEHLIKARRATDVVLALGDAPFARQRKIIRRLADFDVNVATVPKMRQVVEGRISIDAMRPLQIEDLLGRVPVAPDPDLLREVVAQKRVVVTGAGGSIGSELCRQLCRFGAREIVLVEMNEFALFSIHQELTESISDLAPSDRPVLVPKLCNVANENAVRRLFAEAHIDVVFHAAAYKHVPLVEANVIAGAYNNIVGTLHLASAAEEAGVDRFILISSDKAVRPPNVMGATKRVCEMILQSRARQGSDTIFTMVRFGNVLGSSGSVVPTFRRQIEEGGPITLTHRDVTRFFMTIPEAAQLVMQSGGMAEGGDVFVLDMGEPVKIRELARTMVLLAGRTVRDDRNPDGEIAIVETGLRPGEKLYEELLIGENPIATRHPSIMRASETCPDDIALRRFRSLLEEAVDRNDPDLCVAAIRELVPTLHSMPGQDSPAAPARRAGS